MHEAKLVKTPNIRITKYSMYVYPKGKKWKYVIIEKCAQPLSFKVRNQKMGNCAMDPTHPSRCLVVMGDGSLSWSPFSHQRRLGGKKFVSCHTKG